MPSRIALALTLLLVGCMTSDDWVVAAAHEEELSVPSEVRGLLLYHLGTFDGNDRTCATCHTIPTFALSIDGVQHGWRTNPRGALFRALDSDDYDGASYARLREDGLVRVHVTLAPNVRVLDPIDGRDVQLRPDGRYVVTMRRATPTSVNAALSDHLMWDGRHGSDLARQAIGAVIDHAEPGRLPSHAEAASIAAFQRTLFSSPALAAYARGGPPPELPAGRTASERRGRAFFVDGPLSAANGGRGLCATCHSGPMMNTVGQFNPGDAAGLRFAGNRVSELNRRGLRELTYEITAEEDIVSDNPFVAPVGTVLWPAGTVFTLTSPDPGALVVDTDPSDGDDGPANPCISVSGCFVVPGSTVAFHRIPTLRGIGHTAPYFHDNSAATLEDAVRHYRDFFGPTIVSLEAQADFFDSIGEPDIAFALRDQAAALVITDQDVRDVAAYMRLL